VVWHLVRLVWLLVAVRIFKCFSLVLVVAGRLTCKRTLVAGFRLKEYEMAMKKSGYDKTWHPGTPKQQSSAQRQIAANKRAAAKKTAAPIPARSNASKRRSAKKK
jgi:hypothetical protein